jgi:hypothetical protein
MSLSAFSRGGSRSVTGHRRGDGIVDFAGRAPDATRTTEPSVDGEQTGQNLEIHSVGIFTFDGDAMLVEKLYSDVSPLLPFMPWLEQ